MLYCVDVHAASKLFQNCYKSLGVTIILLSSCKYEILQNNKRCLKNTFGNGDVIAPELTCLKMCT